MFRNLPPAAVQRGGPDRAGRDDVPRRVRQAHRCRRRGRYAARRQRAGEREPGAAGRLHLSRPVHRPRHHLRSDVVARSLQRSRRAAGFPHAAPRPRFRSTARVRTTSRSSTRTTASTCCSATTGTSTRPATAGPTCRATTPTPRRALIGDKRNDENSIVSQLQATFLRFHNRVLDTVAGGDFAARAADRALALPVDRAARLPAARRRRPDLPGGRRRRGEAYRRRASTRRRGAMPSFRSSFPSRPTATAIRWCGRAMR